MGYLSQFENETSEGFSQFLNIWIEGSSQFPELSLGTRCAQVNLDPTPRFPKQARPPFQIELQRFGVIGDPPQRGLASLTRRGQTG